jgi:hypothetical protein
MFWIELRRHRIAGMEREAVRLIDLMGVRACATACRLARQANDFSTMRYWSSVQAIIVRKTGEAAAIGQTPENMIWERPRELEPPVEGFLALPRPSA